MILPNAERAHVPPRKVTHYLLNLGHATGGSKAGFFLRFGFTAADWRQLADALVRHARENEVTVIEQTKYGVRYNVDGTLYAPNGAALNIRSAWFIDDPSQAPRFVTAHPLPRK